VFDRCRITHPQTEQNIYIGRWSYLWAGLFGALYVAWKGMGSRFLYALAINIGFALLALSVSAITIMRFVPANAQAVILVAAVPILIAFQGTLMINTVCEGYRKRGWRVRRNE
jgi:hypothetical protein